MTCAVCQLEPKVGRIDVPNVGQFFIGDACYKRQLRAMNGATTLSEFADICLLRPDGIAATEWVKALIEESAPIVSARVDWRGPTEQKAVN